MNLEKINEELEPKIPELITPTRKYGVMGIALGYELHARLKKYTIQKGFSMSKLIKILVKNYLDEMEFEEEEQNEIDKNVKLNRELYLQNQKANPDDTI